MELQRNGVANGVETYAMGMCVSTLLCALLHVSAGVCAAAQGGGGGSAGGGGQGLGRRTRRIRRTSGTEPCH